MGKKGNGYYCGAMKSLDMFGYQVQFKYLGSESKRKSIIGAFFTIIAIGIVLESFFIKL